VLRSDFARSLRAGALLGACLASACVGNIGDRAPPEGGGPGTDPKSAVDGVDVGRTPLRRLTRAQYESTLRDLLGLAPPSTAFAPDELVGSFHSNAVAPVTELIVEQYMLAAEELAALATQDLEELLPCDASADEAGCVAQFIDEFGLRAFRRPLDETERADFAALYAVGNESGGLAGGLRVVVQTVLQSPHFLYHVETGLVADDQSALLVPLGQYELASRLSYFLWNSMPDDELFSAAAAGELDGPEALRAQAERMLEHDKARESISSFHLQWLDVDDVEQLEKDTGVFPEFDASLREAMVAETARFSDWVVRKGDGRLTTLLTAPWSVIDGPLFALYGEDEPATHNPSEPFDLDPEERAGLLTHASVLAKHAHADQSSPVFRGVLVRERLLCQTLPPPPPDVANVPPEPDPDATTRERFAEHTQNPACSGCHTLIDGIGFGFENYDGIGTFRTMENGLAVDATGEVLSTDIADGKFDGVVELAAMLAESDEVRQCVAKQWFRFAYGRLETEHDVPSMDAAYDDFASAGFDVRQLLLAIVSTDAFRHRRLQELQEEGSP
jgi:hypothetical protein